METGRGSPARNRELMRELNSRAVAAFEVGPTETITLACECEEVACFEVVELARSEYDDLVASGGLVLAPGHVVAFADAS
jgi:hypothetical protein